MCVASFFQGGGGGVDLDGNQHFVVLKFGILPQEQPGSFRGGDDDDDETSALLVEETGAPGGNHRLSALPHDLRPVH